MGDALASEPATSTTDTKSKTKQKSQTIEASQAQQQATTQQQATQAGTTTQQLTPEQQRLIELALPKFETYAANPPKAYEGQTVAGFDPLQTQGQQQVLAGVPGQQGIASSAAGAHDFLLNDVLYPGSNPALQATIDAATKPLWQGLTEEALPVLRSEAGSFGQYGGSRQGIAEGLATGRTAQAAGATAADLANRGYQGGLSAMTTALGMTPTVQQSQIAPGLTTSAVGDVRQNLEQQLLNEAAEKYYYNQNAPFLTGEQLASVAAGLPGGTVATAGESAGTSQLDALSTALALALSKGSSSTTGTGTTTTQAPGTNPLLAGVGAAASLLPIFL